MERCVQRSGYSQRSRYGQRSRYRHLYKDVSKMVCRIALSVVIIISGSMILKTGGTFLRQNAGFLTGTEKADTSLGWNLILVNKDYAIPGHYELELTQLSNGKEVDSRIYPALQEMFDDARMSGLQLYVREGYRTWEEQQAIMEERIAEYQAQGYSKQEAKKMAEGYVSIPGTSEHQLGLSVDVNADTSASSSDEVYAWLDANAYRYGFIKRYPSDKTEITGVNHEPWHYRYVGREAAEEMKENNFCLEEYVEWKKSR